MVFGLAHVTGTTVIRPSKNSKLRRKDSKCACCTGPQFHINETQMYQARWALACFAAIVVTGCNARPNQATSQPVSSGSQPATGMIAFTPDGKELARCKSNTDALRSLVGAIQGAHLAKGSTPWDPTYYKAKLSVTNADGTETRYILLRDNRLVKLGRDPREAVWIVDTDRILDLISTAGNSE